VPFRWLSYGTRQFLLIKHNLDDSPETARQLRRILFITVIFFVCFLLRCMIWIARMAERHELQMDVSLALGYYLPEVVPSAVQLYSLKRKREKSLADVRYIEDLYALNEEENETDSVEVLTIGTSVSEEHPSTLVHIFPNYQGRQQVDDDL